MSDRITINVLIVITALLLSVGLLYTKVSNKKAYIEGYTDGTLDMIDTVLSMVKPQVDSDSTVTAMYFAASRYPLMPEDLDTIVYYMYPERFIKYNKRE